MSPRNIHQTAGRNKPALRELVPACAMNQGAGTHSLSAATTIRLAVGALASLFLAASVAAQIPLPAEAAPGSQGVAVATGEAKETESAIAGGDSANDSANPDAREADVGRTAAGDHDQLSWPDRVAGAAAGAGLEESGPRLLYWRDEHGELLPIVFPFTKLEQLFRASQKQQPDEPPRYTIDQLVMRGAVQRSEPETSSDAPRAAVATLAVELTISTRVSGWVHVPLDFRHGLLRNAPAQQLSTGRLVVSRGHEQNDSRFHAWLYSEQPAQHQLSLLLLFPVEQSGPNSQLPLFAPLATSSELELQVPEPHAEAYGAANRQTPVPAIVRPPSPTGANERDEKVTNFEDGSSPIETVHEPSTAEASATKQEGSTLRLMGAVLQEVIRWRSVSSSQVAQAEFVESVGYITAQVDKSGTLISDVQLAVTKAFEPLSTFRIRLPEGSTVVDPQVGDYSFEPLADQSLGNVWLVTLREPARSVELNFKTKFTSNRSRYEIATYDVLGAALQTGTIHVHANDSWRPYWNASPLIRRLTSAATAADGDVTSFAYQGQPCSLEVQVAGNDRRVTVEPIYHMDVDEQRVRLTALLKCKVRGLPMASLEVNVGGWTIDDVGPEALIDGFPASNDGLLSVPLTLAASGEFEFRIEAHLDLDSTAAMGSEFRRLQLALPEPVADTVTPATVVVSATPGLALRPLEEQTGDSFLLISIPPELETRLGPWHSPPLCFRRRGAGTSATLVLDVARNERQVFWSSQTELREITRQRLVMRQLIQLQVLRAPLPMARVGLPVESWRSGSIELLVDGRPLPTTPAPPPPPPTDTGSFDDVHEYEWVFVPLPNAGMGLFQLEARFDVELPTPLSTSPRIIALPLVRVADAVPRQHTFESPALAGWQVALPSDGPWTVGEATSPAAPAHLSASVSGVQPELSLIIRQDASTVAAAAPPAARSSAITSPVVERAWIQTILSHQGRYDRAVYRLQGSNRAISITVPDDLAANSFHLWLDGVPLPSTPVNSDLEVLLPADDQPLLRHTIEISYQLQSRSPAGRIVARVPVIHGAGTVQQWFWQLVLPPDEHLVIGPDELTPASRWQWQGWGFGRTPQLTQPELEDWVSATQKLPLLQGAHVYLYGGFSEVSPLSVLTMKRSTCLVLASGSALCLGMLLNGLHSRYRRYWCAAIGVMALLASAWQPAIASVMAQSGVLGVAAVAGIWAVQWYWQRLRSSGTPWRGKLTRSEHFSLRDASVRVSTISQAPFAKAPSE